MRIGFAVLFLVFAQSAFAERSAYTDEGCKMVVQPAPVQLMPTAMGFSFPSFVPKMSKVCWTKHIKMNQMSNKNVQRWRMTWKVKFKVFDANNNMIWESPEEDGYDMGVMVKGQTVMNKTQNFTVEYDGECVTSTYTSSFDSKKKSVSGSFSDFHSCGS